jgi:hypothetical protein
MISPTCSGVYVAGRPDRGASCKPSSPAVLNRLSHRRTVSGCNRNSAAIAATRCPWLAHHTIRARSTTRAGAVRAWAKRLISSLSSSVSSRMRKATWISV